MFKEYPYENVIVGVEPRVLRVICNARHDAPPWQETLVRHAYENGVAFAARAQAVAARVEQTVGNCCADVVIRCMYETPAARDVANIDVGANALSMLWWLLHSPRVPRRAADNALGTLCRVYSWRRSAMTLASARRLPKPNITALPCAYPLVH